MNNTHYNAVETIIIRAIPSYPSDRNHFTNEVLFLTAKDFFNQFRHAAQVYEDNRRDERFMPCMSQQKYADTIIDLLKKKCGRPIYPDKNNVYQVLFAVSCMMGIKDHYRSWWEDNFGKNTQDYLEHTALFQGAKQQIQGVIHKVESMLQYELDFGSTNPTQSAAQQTLDLFNEDAEMQQKLLPKPQPKTKTKTKQSAKPHAKRRQSQAQLSLNFYGNVGCIITDTNNLKINNNE